jgi:hypothetical protein
MSRFETGRERQPMATKRTRQVVIAVMVLLVVATGAAAWALSAGAKSGGTSKAHAKARSTKLADNPPPQLFPARDARTVEASMVAAQKDARAAARAYVAAHPQRDDAAAVEYAVRTLAPPPRGAEQARQLAQVRALRAASTPAGERASRWLEVYGKAKVWKQYDKQHAVLLHPAEAAREKHALKASFQLGDSALA